MWVLSSYLDQVAGFGPWRDLSISFYSLLLLTDSCFDSSCDTDLVSAIILRFNVYIVVQYMSDGKGLTACLGMLVISSKTQCRCYRMSFFMESSEQRVHFHPSLIYTSPYI
jgi:hypothetical protein